MIWLWMLAAAPVLWFCYGPLPTLWCKYLRSHFLNVNGSEKELLLTFDDGPDPHYTEPLLRLLAEQQVHGVFFLVAEKARKYPEVVRQIQRGGHTVAFHGNSHRNMWLLGPRRTEEEFVHGLYALKSLGISPLLYRPPHGNINLFTLIACRRQGLRSFWWTAMAGDWKLTAGPTLAERLNKKLRPGAVVCLHDSGEGTGGEPGAPAGTLAALALWIPQAKEQGYRFLEPREVLNSEGWPKGAKLLQGEGGRA